MELLMGIKNTNLFQQIFFLRKTPYRSPETIINANKYYVQRIFLNVFFFFFHAVEFSTNLHNYNVLAKLYLHTGS